MFKDKTVLVTGITGTLGLEILSQLIKSEPHKLVLLGRNKSKLLNVQNICRANNLHCSIYEVDLSKTNSLAGQLDNILTAEPQTSVVIQNAGYLKQQNLLDEDASWTQIELENSINYLAPALLTQRFCSHFLKHNSIESAARIINILSLACIVPAPSFTGYSASKMAYKQFCDAFRHEIEHTQIKITNCILGRFESNMTKGTVPYKYVPTRTAEHTASLLFEELKYFPNAHDLQVGLEVRGACLLKSISPGLVDTLTRHAKPKI